MLENSKMCFEYFWLNGGLLAQLGRSFFGILVHLGK